jgi:hypothetical protein
MFVCGRELMEVWGGRGNSKVPLESIFGAEGKVVAMDDDDDIRLSVQAIKHHHQQADAASCAGPFPSHRLCLSQPCVLRRLPTSEILASFGR